jgi:hypothetical protein
MIAMLGSGRRNVLCARWSFVPAFVLTAMLTSASTQLPQTDQVDAAASQSVTSYLRQHRLPLVGAQVLRDTSGNRRLVLYGFVATEFGRKDAVDKALRYLNATNIPVDNRIKVRPEIARMKPQHTPAPVLNSGSQSLDQILNDIERYGVSSPPGEGNLPP